MRNSIASRMAAAFAAALTLVSCGTSKVSSGGSLPNADDKPLKGGGEVVKADFLRKVYDNQVYASCITSKLKFNISTGSKDMTVAGSLKMKRDDVIRIQLTPMGLFEAGRIEFTKDYVLIVDRINKRYMKEDYTKVDFLNRNGLDFHALQALFWNQLYMPGEAKVTEQALNDYSVTFNDDPDGTLIQLERGNMAYRWKAENRTARLTEVNVTYSSSAKGATSVSCAYSAFKPLLTKQFPTDITLNMQSSAVKQGKKLSLNLQLSGLNTDSDWDTRSEVSSKYKRVTADEALKMLTNM